jgi:hypothetical protein
VAVIADDYFETVYFDEFSQEKSRLLSCVCYIVTNDSALTFKLRNFSSHSNFASVAAFFLLLNISFVSGSPRSRKKPNQNMYMYIQL